MSSGRPRDPIWEFFKERQDLGENKTECITCKKVMVGNAKRKIRLNCSNQLMFQQFLILVLLNV